MNFEQIYQIVEESSNECAFNKEECLALYNILNLLQEGSTVVEVGVSFGRSMSVICEVAKEKNFQVVGVDNWIEEQGERAKAHFLSQKEKHNWNMRLYSESSESVAKKVDVSPIDLIHIDGDHEYQAVLLDCKLWLPKVRTGGYALFDDYGHDSLPGVYKAVLDYTDKHFEWKFVGRFGNKLGIYKKL